MGQISLMLISAAQTYEELIYKKQMLGCQLGLMSL